MANYLAVYNKNEAYEIGDTVDEAFRNLQLVANKQLTITNCKFYRTTQIHVKETRIIEEKLT